MDILNIASKLFIQKMGGNGSALSGDAVQSALGSLLPTKGGELDLGSIIGMFQGNGGLASLVGSWLGDGGNEALSPSNLLSMLGDSKVNEFASSLNLSKDQASEGLSSMIPDLIDKASSGGSLKSDIGGALVKGLAGKLFG